MVGDVSVHVSIIAVTFLTAVIDVGVVRFLSLADFVAVFAVVANTAVVGVCGLWAPDS